MKTPQHWQNKNWLAAALYLPGCLYAAATWCRLAFCHPKKTKAPVICIGNLTAGGSGKTPVAISLVRILKQDGKNPFFISRGYGGKLQDVVVDLTKHTPQEVGDEPLLLAAEAPVIVNRRRYEGACKAIAHGADIIVMDDGFQNPGLYKDKSFLVVDGSFGLGNMCPIPAGPLREFLSQGLKRADAIILLGDDKCNILSKIGKLPVFRGTVVPALPQNVRRPVIAFAGIGRPQKFYQSLNECGIDIVKTFDFPDHHFYSLDELQSIIDEAQLLQADIYTTSKDMVKIPQDLRSYFKVLEIEISWQDEDALRDFLLK